MTRASFAVVDVRKAQNQYCFISLALCKTKHRQNRLTLVSELAVSATGTIEVKRIVGTVS